MLSSNFSSTAQPVANLPAHATYVAILKDLFQGIDNQEAAQVLSYIKIDQGTERFLPQLLYYSMILYSEIDPHSTTGRDDLFELKKVFVAPIVIDKDDRVMINSTRLAKTIRIHPLIAQSVMNDLAEINEAQINHYVAPEFDAFVATTLGRVCFKQWDARRYVPEVALDERIYQHNLIKLAEKIKLRYGYNATLANELYQQIVDQFAKHDMDAVDFYVQKSIAQVENGHFDPPLALSATTGTFSENNETLPAHADARSNLTLQDDIIVLGRNGTTGRYPGNMLPLPGTQPPVASDSHTVLLLMLLTITAGALLIYRFRPFNALSRLNFFSSRRAPSRGEYMSIADNDFGLEEPTEYQSSGASKRNN